MPTLEKLKKTRAERRLADFVEMAWHTVEPVTPYKHGRHIEAICAHLEAVTSGKISDLLINVPPGFCKSLIVSVFWPAWVWTTQPGKKFVFTSYDANLTTRDSQKCRSVIQSEWYRANWGGVKICSDQNVKTRFLNTKSGYRISSGIGGGTGERADFFVADDPHNIQDSDAPNSLAFVRTWWDETVSMRAADPSNYHRIIIMQRVHANDLSGYVLAKGGYEHLCLPMRYEADRRCKTSIFEDWRSEPGELLWPERWSKEMVEKKEAELKTYATASQLQQRPMPRGGGLFKREWFTQIVDGFPADARQCRYWDMAATEEKQGNDPDWTVGARLGLKDGLWYIIGIRRLRGTPMTTEQAVRQTAETDGPISIRMEEEGGSSGKTVIEHYSRRVLVGRNFLGVRSTGSKATRAEPFMAAAEAGNVRLVRGPWIEDFLDEAENFPNGAHDDQIDAVAGAFNAIHGRPKYFV